MLHVSVETDTVTLSYRSAHLWIQTLFGLALVLFLLNLGVHVHTLLSGGDNRWTLALFGGAIAVSFSTMTLRETRSVWPSEIENCPKFALVGLMALISYVLAVIVYASFKAKELALIQTAIAMLLCGFSALLSKALTRSYREVSAGSSTLPRKALDSMLALGLAVILVCGICVSRWR